MAFFISQQLRRLNYDSKLSINPDKDEQLISEVKNGAGN